MAQEYKVTAVSPKTKEWSSQYGDMVTYYVKVDSETDAVQMNKKADSKPPQVGDELYGTITSTEYGLKFKGEKKPFNTKPAYEPREDHHEAIKAQWAIGQAVQLMLPSSAKNALSPAVLEDTAKMFFAMVDRVKSSEPKTAAYAPATGGGVAKGYDTFKQAGEAVKAKQETFSDGTPVPTDAELDATNDKDFLDSIPF
jgi:predicted Abi (CAAX) family protease